MVNSIFVIEFKLYYTAIKQVLVVQIIIFLIHVNLNAKYQLQVVLDLKVIL